MKMRITMSCLDSFGRHLERGTTPDVALHDAAALLANDRAQPLSAEDLAKIKEQQRADRAQALREADRGRMPSPRDDSAERAALSLAMTHRFARSVTVARWTGLGELQ